MVRNITGQHDCNHQYENLFQCMVDLYCDRKRLPIYNNVITKGMIPRFKTVAELRPVFETNRFLKIFLKTFSYATFSALFLW